MTQKKIRLVVVVRCPLCGSWMNGNDTSGHIEQVHLRGRPDGRTEPLVYIADSTVEDFVEEDRVAEAWSQVAHDEALRLLSELGRRRQQGQTACLAFELYE